MPETTEVKTEESVDLNKSIQSSIDESAKATEKVEKEETKEAAATSEGKEEKEQAKPDELSEEERNHALSLWKLLRSKDTAVETVTLLAKQAGVIETKQEAKVVAKSITEVFKEELGEEYGFMADKLAPAVEKIVSQLVEDKTKHIKTKFEKDNEAKIANEVEQGFTKLSETYEDSENYLKEMYDLMETNPPTDKISAEDYFKNLYFIAKGRASSQDKATKLREKIERNRNDASSRLASGGKGTTVKGTAAPQDMSLQDAVAKALEDAATG